MSYFICWLGSCDVRVQREHCGFPDRVLVSNVDPEQDKVQWHMRRWFARMLLSDVLKMNLQEMLLHSGLCSIR